MMSVAATNGKRSAFLPRRTRDKKLRRSKFLAPLVFAVSLLACQTHALRLGAQDEPPPENREWRIKAAYLYQFGNYIEWPASASASAESPFAIGVLTAGPLADNLDDIASAKKIQGRHIQVYRFSSPDELKPCHILFISSAVSPEIQAKVISQCRQTPVLLVSDAEGFIERGGTIRFFVEDNNIRLLISRKLAQAQQLSIRAKLLQVAHVVD